MVHCSVMQQPIFVRNVPCLPQVSLPRNMSWVFLPAEIERQAYPGQRHEIELVMWHGSWQARVVGKPDESFIAAMPDALISALQLSPGAMICLTLLRPGQLLITTEDEPHFSAAAVGDPTAVVRAAASAASIARRVAEGAARAAANATQAAAVALLLPLASKIELMPNIDRFSLFKVCEAVPRTAVPCILYGLGHRGNCLTLNRTQSCSVLKPFSNLFTLRLSAMEGPAIIPMHVAPVTNLKHVPCA